MGQVLNGNRLTFRFDCLFDRDDMHADAGASRRNQFGRKLKRLLRRKVEHGRDFRMQIRQGRMLDHIFAASDNPLRNQILNVVIRVVTVLFNDSDPKQMIDDFLRFIFAHVVPLGEFLCGTADTALFEADHELHFIFCKHAVKNPEVHMILVHAAGEFARDVIGDHPRKFQYKFLFFRIVAMIIFLRKIALIDMNAGIHFSRHDLFSLLFL